MAVLLAREVAGEIVNCDAMQVYREVAVANNKPPTEVLRETPHHLISVVSVLEKFDVARFYQLATAAIADICARGKVPVVVGGSGLYAQVLLDGIFADDAKDDKVRRQLQQRAQQEGTARLHAELREVDPDAAAKIHVNDARRIIRALEVFMVTGQPISKLQRSREGLSGQYDVVMFGLKWSSELLYQRINARVEQMVRDGLVEEMERLRDVELSPAALRMIGVPEVQNYLRGEYDLPRMISLIQLHTRHFARRQMIWFRKEKRIQWVEAADDPSVAADRILKLMTKSRKPSRS